MKICIAILIFIIFTFFPVALLSQVFIETHRFGGAGNGAGQFQKSSAIAISREGSIYITDTGNNRIQQFDAEGQFLKTIGGFGFAEDQFNQPLDIWTASIINIYISDYNNRRIQRYDRNLNFLSSLQNQVSLPANFQFQEVGSCAVSSQNDLFLLDCGEKKIIKFNRNGQPERCFGTYESGEGQLQNPVQLDILNDRLLLVSDADLKAVLVFDLFGNYLSSITNSDFIQPAGIAAGGDGRVFIADPVAKLIFVVKSDLKTVTSLPVHIVKPMMQPQDVAIQTSSGMKKESLLYILDRDEVIAGNLVEP